MVWKPKKKEKFDTILKLSNNNKSIKHMKRLCKVRKKEVDILVNLDIF